MDEKRADTKLPILLEAAFPPVAQAESNELLVSAPRGSTGTVAIHFNA
jgi:hypothetical protein